MSDNQVECPAFGKSSLSLRRVITNRWVRCAGYTWVTLSCAAIYFGWQQFQKILFRGGVYSWLCEEEDPNWSYETHGACDEQNAKAQMLYTVASAMEYVVGVFAGAILDHTGPRSCGLIGLATLFVGVITLIISSEKLQLYVLSFFLLGASVNMVAMPTLLASDFFPGHEAAVISYFISCQIGCALLAVILLALMRGLALNLQQVFMWYLCVGWLPSLFFFIFLLPCRRRVSKQVIPPREESTATAIGERPLSNSSMGSANQEHVFYSGDDGLRQRRNNEDAGNNDAELLQGNWKDFGAELATWDIQIFSVYYVLQILQFVYYPTTTLRMFGEWISDFAGYVMPTQALFGLIMGYVVDRVGTLPLCFFMTSLNVLSFILMLIPSADLQYVTIFANLIAQSFIFTSKYTYVTELYNPHNFGKLAGYIGFLGGVFTFLNIPISASKNFRFWGITFLVLDGLCFGILVLLTVRKKRGVTYVKKIQQGVQE